MPDPTTQANYLQACSTHVDFEWTLDFAEQIVEGSATHTILVREEDVEEVMYMTIKCLWNLLDRIDKVFSKVLTHQDWK